MPVQTKHYTIPIFIPELACPFRCIYCDQHKITGKTDMPGPDEISTIIDQHLGSFPKRKKEVEVGFFGGNFTGIGLELQEKYLRVAREYMLEGRVQGIRLSTRPDYINEQVMKLLKKYKVGTVELGAQSMVDKVLLASRRGHSVEDTLKAADMIRRAHIRLGMQMMTGLPGATAEDDLETARMIAGMQADDARIYPTLVIRGTALEALFRKGEYTPLQMDEAVGRSAGILKELENGGVNVIRVGLHPSDSFLRGDELVAGPFHVAFRELVMTEVWAGIFEPLRKKSDHGKLHIEVSPRQFNFAIGHAAKNRKALLEYYDTVVFFRNADLKGREYHVHYH